MKTLCLIPAAAIALMLGACSTSQKQTAATDVPTLKDAFKDSFLIGAAVTPACTDGIDHAADSLVSLHFNSIVAENCMKSEKINPAEGVYDWKDADSFVDYGTRHGMKIIGHTLVWHSQLAPWFPVDSTGKYVTADVFKERLRNHITTVMTRYKGKIHGWDVVNEAILDDGTYRKSPFYDILGEEFIPFAFECAAAADPEAELYLNDYSMASPAKRETYIRIINDLRKRGIRIDGIGMQGHMGMDYPDFDEFEKSIVEYGKTGVGVMITEWDMSALPTVNTGANVADTAAYNKMLNPYPDGLPEDIDRKWNDRMGRMMEMFLRHSDVITRVTAWGVTDGDSWKNNWPVRGRTEYPLLFSRSNEPKPFLNTYLSK